MAPRSPPRQGFLTGGQDDGCAFLCNDAENADEGLAVCILLKIYAASRNMMLTFIEAQTVDVLKAAYTEMLNGCLEHPDQWDWYAIWMSDLIILLQKECLRNADLL